jgi:kynurenine formamidase
MPAGLAPDGLLYLLDRFSPAVVGIDGPSLDFGGSALSRLVCNLEAARRGVFHLENVALLPDGVPHEADYLLMPLRIAGATGSPARFMLAAR